MKLNTNKKGGRKRTTRQGNTTADLMDGKPLSPDPSSANTSSTGGYRSKYAQPVVGSYS